MNFVKLSSKHLDCIAPFGFANGKLPDSAFSAGSYLSENQNVANVRENRENAWCPKEKDNGSWFKIDFGDVSKLVCLRYYYRLWFTNI